MATLKFRVLTKKNPSNINIRFIHGREIECFAQSDILIDPKYWSNKINSVKNSANSDLREDYRNKIETLKNHIIKCFNEDFTKGMLINSKWLSNLVKEFHKRPSDENDYRIFLIPFIEKFITDSESRINLSTGKRISPRTIQKYNTTKGQIKDYEKNLKSPLKLSDVNLDFHRKFTSYLKLEKKYSNTLIEKILGQLKSFLREAKEAGFETNIEFESKKFTFRRDEPIDTYLNLSEIDLIYNLELDNNERLSKVRDLFVIGLWTGLRISDLKRINQFQINKNTIIISETEKTGAIVEIPIHPQVKDILQKRNNQLPEIISEQNFNLYVKELCCMAGITDIILGNLKNPETNRKEKGYFPKYKLISSHTARRSFATNHYGKLPDNTIMAITTHKSHSQFMKYIKTTQKEHIEQVAKYWEEQDELKNSKAVLKANY